MEAAADVFLPFLLQNCEHDLLNTLQQPDLDQHYGIPISLTQLASFDHGLVDTIIASPRAVLPCLDAALVKAQITLLQRPLPNRHILSIKENTHARLRGLSYFLDASTTHPAHPRIGEVSSAHIDRLITVRGTVVRTGAVKLLESRRLYECNKCKHRFVIAADLEQGATVQLPAACPSRRDNPCKGTNFKHIEEVSLYTNYQEIQLQEGRQCLTVGAAPKTLTVVLQDDLADSCHVGEVVETTGVVIKQWGGLYPGIRCHVGLALQATAIVVAGDRRTTVEVTPEAEKEFTQHWERARASGKVLEARDAILSSFCPQLWGLFSVKLASMLMLIGGMSTNDKNASTDTVPSTSPHPLAKSSSGTTRGEIHFLLVGDPGTGKSQVQRYVSRLAPRAVLTSGKSSSAAGLTAATIRDGAHWTLEAGALVLADGGVCCIDEFDAVRESDRAALHEAMEQQTCSVAKAGMVASLHTRAAVFGTCNPRGNKRYNPRRPLYEQLDISGPLLSRFDIVLLLLDEMNPVWDEAVADHILQGHVDTPLSTPAHGTENVNVLNTTQTTDTRSLSSCMWSPEMLRQYVAWVKKQWAPVMTPPAEQILSGYYQLRRRAAGRHAARTTLRLLESLVRLSQAHARLMAKNTVDVVDAVTAVLLIDSSVVDGESVLGGGGGGSGGFGNGLAAPGDQFHSDPDGVQVDAEAKVVAVVQEYLATYGNSTASGNGMGNDGTMMRLLPAPNNDA